jgi:hypothetical protein
MNSNDGNSGTAGDEEAVGTVVVGIEESVGAEFVAVLITDTVPS